MYKICKYLYRLFIKKLINFQLIKIIILKGDNGWVGKKQNWQKAYNGAAVLVRGFGSKRAKEN